MYYLLRNNYKLLFLFLSIDEKNDNCSEDSQITIDIINFYIIKNYKVLTTNWYKYLAH